ncbi:PCI domain protein [Dictyocaulus viviparus]|uniref:PCI domain protein n=1 Tax=Dictyocaulus viviparus TaxID=29172 RepID=A0A0D8XM89_DICVI|nr:PCI domain protein [Dictyocaulus viviparus]
MATQPMTLQRVEDMVSSRTDDRQYSEDELKECEEILMNYAKKLSNEGNMTDLRKLLVITRPFYDVLGKAKASKLIRALVECCLTVNQDNNEKVNLVKECIDWAEANSRVFLRRTLQARLVRLLNDIGRFVDAQKIAAPLTTELKKMEDRELLMEVTLEESRSAFALKNYAKAKSSLILARSNATGTFVSTQMQATLDLQSGILYSAEEKDFKTAYSYCYEALEGFLLTDVPKAVRALKYMCLCKIMMNEAESVPFLLSTKVAQSIRGRDVDAMKCMAEAFKERSLTKFSKCLKDYHKELVEDPVVSAHSKELRDNMLEKEISRVIEPYSEIDLLHIVRCVGMTNKQIEKALSMMLLDKKFFGVIDQHNGTLRIYQTPRKDITYQKSVELIRALSKAVDGIYNRASSLLK